MFSSDLFEDTIEAFGHAALPRGMFGVKIPFDSILFKKTASSFAIENRGKFLISSDKGLRVIRFYMRWNASDIHKPLEG